MRRFQYKIKDDSSELDFRTAQPMRDYWINGKNKLITYLCCLFSTVQGSLSQEILYCYLYCNRKCYFSSSELYWQKQPPEVFYQKGVLTNFSKFTGKHLCQNLSFKRLYYRFFWDGSNHALLALSFSCIENKITWRYSSSRLQMFLKIGVLKNFANFIGKQLHWNFFFITLKALSPATLLKKDSNSSVFLWNLWKC